jgi:predicted  nucleic acid-binding Zn-ribbon protein
MKKIKLFEQFVKDNRLIAKLESIINTGFPNIETFINEGTNISALTEASKTDFKPSLDMVKWALGDRGKSSANDNVKFATTILTKWDELDDETKEKSLDKWHTMKGQFKREVSKIRDAADNGDNMLKAITRDITSSAPKAKEIYAAKIEPLLADGGESSSKGNEEKIKAEIEKVKAELEKAENAFAKARKDYDDKKIKWDEVQPLVQPKMDLEAKLINLEGQLDDDEDAKEDVKDLKKLQAEYAAAEAEFAKARKDYDDKKIKWDEVKPYVTKMMDIESQIAALA